jgi:hypothetical protein
MYYEVTTLEEHSPPGYSAQLSDFVEQRTADDISIPVQTTEFSTAFVTVLAARTADTVPQSFLNALADFQAGRVVDIEIALNDPPPGA